MTTATDPMSATPVVATDSTVVLALAPRQAAALAPCLAESGGDPGMAVVETAAGPVLAVHAPQAAVDRLAALAAAAGDRWFALTCGDLALATARILEERGWRWEPVGAAWGHRYVLHGPPTLGEVLEALDRAAGLALPAGDPGWETVWAAGRLAARLRRAIAAGGPAVA